VLVAYKREKCNFFSHANSVRATISVSAGKAVEFDGAAPEEEEGRETDAEAAAEPISEGESDKIINGELAEEGTFTSVVCN